MSSHSDVAMPWSVHRLLQSSRDYLIGHGVEDARLSAEVCLAHVLGCRRIELYTRFDRIPTDDERFRLRELVRRAAGGEPVAYLVGEREFFSLAFYVTPEVLIPRPETELLVERVLDDMEHRGVSQPRIVELGVGSGCIIISILKHLQSATGVGVDISSAALEVASRNAARHGVAPRLTLVRADWLEIPSEHLPSGGFHALVANPPYIPAANLGQLAPCIRDFEPHLALTDGADGLTYYRRIAARGHGVLAESGAVFVEVGDEQALAVTDIMTPAGFRLVYAVRDRTTGRERVLHFEAVEHK